jgi:acyl-coenzyme A thioesterase PaaI-like protein
LGAAGGRAQGLSSSNVSADFAISCALAHVGRTLAVCDARAFALDHGAETLIATMTGTLMAMTPRA